jgi:L-asparaginase
VAKVAIVFTGGTISSAADPVAGGNVPKLSGQQILALVPGLDTIAETVVIDRGRTAASHFRFGALLEIGDVLAGLLGDSTVDGAVVVQGTDTIEETSFCWDLVHASDKPVVVTGAMRASDEAGFDGPANLRDAVIAAAAPGLRGAGVVVCLAGQLDAADDVAKTHASSLTTFRSPNTGPLATVDRGEVHVLRERAGRRHVATTAASERIHLVTATVGMDGTLIDAAREAGADGFVVAATGTGNTSLELLEAGRRAMDAGLPVALTTRTGAGRAAPAYAFPGGGAQWVGAGALLAGTLSGPKARVVLALGVGADLDRPTLAALMAGTQSS